FTALRERATWKVGAGSSGNQMKSGKLLIQRIHDPGHSVFRTIELDFNEVVGRLVEELADREPGVLISQSRPVQEYQQFLIGGGGRPFHGDPGASILVQLSELQRITLLHAVHQSAPWSSGSPGDMPWPSRNA